MAGRRRKKELWCDSKTAVYLFRMLGALLGLLTIRHHNKVGYSYLAFGIYYLIWLPMAEIRYRYDTLGYFLHQCHQHCFLWFVLGCFSCYFVYYFI